MLRIKLIIKYCVSCWITDIYCKMIHGPYNIKLTGACLQHCCHWGVPAAFQDFTNTLLLPLKQRIQQQLLKHLFSNNPLSNVYHSLFFTRNNKLLLIYFSRRMVRLCLTTVAQGQNKDNVQFLRVMKRKQQFSCLISLRKSSVLDMAIRTHFKLEQQSQYNACSSPHTLCSL